MLFNSLQFLAFLPVVFVLYWFAFGRSLKCQNLFVVVASYVFYGWWDWRFLILIAFTSFWAWAFGVMDLRWRNGRKLRMVLSVVVNLGILGIFKYYNFFSGQAVVLLNALGFHADLPTVKLILPVGISFYTFQALSYTIDVYRRNIEPVRDPVALFAFVSFFLQLVAGPIERATNLLPQFIKPRRFEYPAAVDGCRQMLWGFFKKMVVADGCAELSRYLVTVGGQGRWITIWIAIFCFTIQIYGDFSGYSDIAIGCSKLFGINLKRNFHFPYFARDIAEFWRRWHISLTTWFRDYLYIPLGGSRCGKIKTIRNTFVIFLVSGLWHGANWTFLAWGLFHALLFMPLLLSASNRRYLGEVAEGRMLPTMTEFLRISFTFFLAMIGWAIFLAPDLSTCGQWLMQVVTFSGGLKVSALSGASPFVQIAPWIAVMFTVEWFNRFEAYGCARFPKNRPLRWGVYWLLVLTIFLFRAPKAEFIYFQF